MEVIWVLSSLAQGSRGKAYVPVCVDMMMMQRPCICISAACESLCPMCLCVSYRHRRQCLCTGI